MELQKGISTAHQSVLAAKNIVEIVHKLPSHVDQIKYGKSISEMPLIDFRIAVIAIMQKHLSVNVKGKSILEKEQTNVIIDFLLNECKNLQLEEINIIFKNGILGRYGTIYNEISIDTICGIDGWIERYYAQDRKKIKEPQYIEVVKYNGTEMTYDQWLDRNPEIKKSIRIKEIKKTLSTNKAQLKHVIEYCELLGHNWDDKKVKLMSEYEKFDHKEMLTFEQWCIVFIKTKIKK